MGSTASTAGERFTEGSAVVLALRLPDAIVLAADSRLS